METSNSGATTKTYEPKEKINEYAFCGNRDFFNYKLESLKKLAEPEDWDSKGSKFPNNRLYFYIVKTFERCFDQNLIIESKDHTKSIFNTGLITPNGEDIYGYFEINNPDSHILNPQKWKFMSFYKASYRTITDSFDKQPILASYTNKPEDFYFDTEKDIIPNIDHIIDDHWDEISNTQSDENDLIVSRFPEELINMGKNVVISLVIQALAVAEIRIKRNNRLIIPQFYNNEIMYLIPIRIPVTTNKYITLALAVEKTKSGNYRANTIFTIDMAYSKARLIMKPESNWLIDDCE